MDRLDVQMLGGFSITYNNKKLPLEKNNIPKYMLLLQYILLEGSGGRAGVSKQQLTEALYDEWELSNSGNSVNNLLYQLRMKLIKIGLPEYDYIVRVNGRYRMSAELDIHVDVHEFEQLMASAREASSDREKERYYSRAFELYQGELLPQVNMEIWVMVENVRLEALYRDCIHGLSGCYRAAGDFDALERLYRRAAQLDRFYPWEIDWIDIMVGEESCEQALQVFNDAFNRYAGEPDGVVTDEMLRCYNRIRSKSRLRPGKVDQIVREIGEHCADGIPSVNERGPYCCKYSTFMDICRVYQRSMERTGSSVYLMICTIQDPNNRVLQNEGKLKEWGSALRRGVLAALRRSDVFTQYSASQCLILLADIGEEDCETVYRRICHSLKKEGGGNVGIRYDAIPLEDL